MAGNIDPHYFKALFDEFDGVSDPKVQAYIDIASSRVPSGVWGTNTNYATALLVAHMLTASGAGGLGPSGGPVTNEAVGDVSRGYASIAEQGSGDAALMTTRYGIDFVALRKETVVGATVTGPTPFVPGGLC